ncbi:TPA: hypothetical protein IAB29_01535 [Candidatus Ventrenecus stercoripullorum]|nr:hypothetical protein [Candidatus Ventrenecus stercoripullorum]
MKYIKDNNTLYLSNGDFIIVKSENQKKYSVKIECSDGIIIIDNIPEKRIKELALEQEQVVTLKKYNAQHLKIKTLYRNPSTIKIHENIKIISRY